MATPPIEPTPESQRRKLNAASLKWLIGKVAFLKSNQSFPGAINPKNYINARLFSIGDMFMYHYDPKWKHILPYYDTFPLVIPIGMYSDGFLGLNLHYLPPTMRRNFLNKLILYTTMPGDHNAKMQISYDILKGVNMFSEFVPCVKRYLIDHVRGRMMRIFPHEWPMVINIPSEAFVKASKQKVWADSRRMV